MKVSYELNNVWPKFILNDKNGYAVAKALDAGMKFLLERIGEGLDTLQDPEKMPEWRLDELAWEYNIPYDSTAPIEIKRMWVGDAFRLSRQYGTAEGISKYMGAYFADSEVEESWEYDGEPLHFRIVFGGGWTPENVAWATKAALTVKNVRSLLDEFLFRQSWTQTLRAGTAFWAEDRGNFPVSSEDASELVYYADEDGDMLLDELGHPFLAEEDFDD